MEIVEMCTVKQFKTCIFLLLFIDFPHLFYDSPTVLCGYNQIAYNLMGVK